MKNIGFPLPTRREGTQVSDAFPFSFPKSELNSILCSDAKLNVKELSSAQLTAARLIQADFFDYSNETRALSLKKLNTCTCFVLTLFVQLLFISIFPSHLTFFLFQ